MKSTEVYALLREEVGPWAKIQGFKRAKVMLSWTRPFRDRHLNFWFQVSQDGWDPYAGSKFTMEFESSDSPQPGWSHESRKRLFEMLAGESRDRMRALQNEVIAGLPKPPRDYYALSISEDVRTWFLNKFQRVTEPFKDGDDVWMRYHSADHVRRWGRFVLEHLPACITQVENWS